MNDKIEILILEQLNSMRSDLHVMNGELVKLRDEIAELRIGKRDAKDVVRSLWDEGLESGDAGDIDDVFARVLKATKPAGRVM
ncbi:MAG: hypothetical protein ACKOBC_11680 [Hyphomicrobiales bacterium]